MSTGSCGQKQRGLQVRPQLSLPLGFPSRLLSFPPNESKMSAGILGSIPESPKRNPEISDLPEWLDGEPRG